MDTKYITLAAYLLVMHIKTYESMHTMISSTWSHVYIIIRSRLSLEILCKLLI